MTNRNSKNHRDLEAWLEKEHKKLAEGITMCQGPTRDMRLGALILLEDLTWFLMYGEYESTDNTPEIRDSPGGISPLLFPDDAVPNSAQEN